MTTLVADAPKASINKKVQTFTVSRELRVSAEQAWAVIADYGNVAFSHPAILESEIIGDTEEVGNNTHRACYFNEDKSQYMEEKIMDYSPETFSFTNQVTKASKFPLVPELTRGFYKIDPISDEKSLFTFTMEFRTKPAFLGAVMKGKFKSLIGDYFTSIVHYATTGEKITKENFRRIK